MHVWMPWGREREKMLFFQLFMFYSSAENGWDENSPLFHPDANMSSSQKDALFLLLLLFRHSRFTSRLEKDPFSDTKIPSIEFSDLHSRNLPDIQEQREKVWEREREREKANVKVQLFFFFRLIFFARLSCLLVCTEGFPHPKEKGHLVWWQSKQKNI